MKHVVHAACPHDCPDACGVLITVEDGRATKIQGDPEHPVTRGFLCAKVAKYLDRVYSPDRVLYPMRRIAAKGPAADAACAGGGARATPTWQRISWDEALDEIAARLRSRSRGVWQRGDSALFLRWNAGGAQWRVDGPAIFPSAGGFAAGSHDLFRGRRSGAEVRAGREAGDRAGAVPAFQVHHCVGFEHPRRTTCICGRSSRRHGATARSWW